MKKRRILSIILTLILLNISIFGALTIESVSTNPDLIAPGEISFIKLGLENNGDSTIEEVSVVLDLSQIPFAPSESSSEAGFDEIKKNRIKYAEFEMIALNDAESGIYKIPVEISYEEGGEVKRRNSLIAITVKSEPIIDANIEEGLFLKEQENEISIKIINKGLADAKFLEAELESSIYYEILSPEKIYIGNIDSDDFDSVDFKILFKSNAPSFVTLPIIVRYKDSFNEEYAESFNLPIKIYTSKRAVELGLIKKSNTIIYVILVLIIIFLYIIYKRWRKRKKLKKAKAIGEED